MQDFPHLYRAAAVGGPEAGIDVESPGIPSLVSAAPAEFGGPGDRWSPETLVVAAVANCFILTFRAFSAPAKLPWRTLRCEVEGKLDRVDRMTRFTEVRIHATLRVAADVDETRARKLLERTEQNCLITNSLVATSHFSSAVEVDG